MVELMAPERYPGNVPIMTPGGPRSIPVEIVSGGGRLGRDRLGHIFPSRWGGRRRTVIQEVTPPIPPPPPVPLNVGWAQIIDQTGVNAGTPSREGLYVPGNIIPLPGDLGRVPVGRAFTVRNLVVNVETNTGDGFTTITLMVNGVASAYSVTFAPGETGAKFSDLIGVSLVAGDRISYLISTTSTVGDADNISATAELRPDPAAAFIALYGVTERTVAGGDSWEGTYQASFTAPEPSVRISAPRSGSLRRLEVFVTANTLGGNAVVTVQVAGVNTALTVTYAAGETGRKTVDVPVAVAMGQDVSLLTDASAMAGGSISLTASFEEIP